MNLKMDTKVFIEFPDISFYGIIVGKGYNTTGESYIITCTDETIPNDTYRYPTVIVPLVFIRELI